MAYTVILEGGSPWGFRLRGGYDFNETLRIAKLNPNSKAYNQGVKVGDYLDCINGANTTGLKLNEALQLIRNANNRLELELRRSDNRKTSIPEIRINGPPLNGNLSDSDYYYSSCDEAEGIVRTNAITNYTSSGSGSGHQSDGDNSGSTSGSQSSVVHVVGPYKGPLAEKMKNIANSTNGPGPGASSTQPEKPQTAVWSPFGPNKVKTYKPVSFNLSNSILGSSQTQGNAPLSIKTSSYSSTSPDSTGTHARQSTRNVASLDNVQTGQPRTDENVNSSGTSYSNFNGSGSVMVSSPPPGSSYTSITMSSKKADDFNPTQKYSLFGASTPPINPPSTGYGSPSPIKTCGSESPTKSPLTSGPFSPQQQKPEQQQPFVLDDPPKPKNSSGSPTKLNIGPLSPTKSSFGPNSPTKSSFRPNSPLKSNISSSGPFPSLTSPHSQRRPLSPTKSVTFGPVTSLGDTSTQDATDASEPQLSVSQTRSLFEQKQNQPHVQPQPPRMQPSLQPQKNTPAVTLPKTQISSPYSAITAKSSAPSNTTGGATVTRPLSPRPFSPAPGATLKSPPTVAPKSPQAKSKGLAMFLSMQEKHHDAEDSVAEFTDSEEPMQRPKSPALTKLPKQVPGSPIVGRATPIKVESTVKDETSKRDDISLNNNNSSSFGSLTSPTHSLLSSSVSSKEEPKPATTTPKTDLWSQKPEQATTFGLDPKENTAERTQEHEEELKLRNTPLMWNSEPGKKDFRSVKLDPHKLKSPETVMRSTSPTISPEESFAWKPTAARTTAVSSSTVTTTTTTTTATLLTPSTTSYTSHNGSISHHQEAHSGLPSYQSPTITLLQKSRELHESAKANGGLDESSTTNDFEIPPDVTTMQVEEDQIPEGAVLVGTKESTEGSKKHYDSYYMVPGEQRERKTQKVVEKKASKYEGIGPTDEKTGVPIVPRGSVDKKSHKDWYKRMYQSLHKQDRKDEPNAYKPTYVFPDFESESEIEDKGSTMSLDRSVGGYGKRAYTLPHARYREEKYKNQPRSLETYEPGFSSIAFREAHVSPTPNSSDRPKDAAKSSETKIENESPKNGDQKSEKSYLYNPPIEKPGQFSRYITSDSEPDIKKKERPLSPGSDIENREAYRRFQKGGDVPYQGLRFPVPPKKDEAEEDEEKEESVLRSKLQSPVLLPIRKHVRSKSTSAASPENTRSQSAVERLGIKSPPPTGPSISKRERSHSTSERHEPRPRHSMPGSGRSPTGSWDRKMREEEIARRKQEMQRITSEEKRKRMEIEMRANEARRHNDFLTPSQKSPIALNRYEDPPDVPSLQRPKKKSTTQAKGKARALYNFNAQNPKEMSFRKHDVIYLLRQIDKNWYEGEHHGRVGIFPVNYVEVLTSLDEAREAAILKEGQGRAKHSFTAQSGMELSFKKGETVRLVRRIDDNWYEGRCGRRHGIFPISYVEVFTEPDTPFSSYAPTPVTGSPGQLSPVSTISNGPAPTIPSAPISPRSSIDNFDFGQPYNMGQPSPASYTLPRDMGHHSYQSDYGVEAMRPSSALGGHTDGYYDSMQRDRYNLMNRPSSAVPFTDYYGKHSMTRDSEFHSSDESKFSRQQSRQQDPIAKSMSNSYEARIRQNANTNRPLDEISLVTEETQYPKYRALYNYKPQNADELALMEGDIVYVMERCDDDWYVGTSERTKEFGTFPGNYVRLL